MAVPSYDKFIEPILRYLVAHPTGAPARDAHEASAQALGISDADRQELLASSSHPIYKNRAGWAHDRLKRAGLSSSPRRGHWQITEQGLAFAQSHPAPLSPKDVEQLAVGFIDVRLKPPPNSESLASVELVEECSPTSSVASPDDRLAEAVSELRQTVAAELLETLGSVSPSFFETIVLDLLHRMGYGASRADLQRVGGSGDGGIDGVISLDKLGLEKVYVQAKRWQQAVGRPEVQAFYGALAGQRANKGVFITTSAYTAQAIGFAKSVERVVLVDGARLAELMIDNEVGVSARTVKVPKVDSDYFDEEST
ncbi:restriction endonuclease [Paraburkholderia panacisoli]|uniref:Restriction endonuclease n=1 Tax=Paraburkholderia panacisoli TaxID=2603818 RepID=A0A5B0HBE0_9BURK|nr:restriction endonuclease [Paraburkholderia panacisoli]KAA1012626.1 restriction endonuclease [Paraburkholderia panacisoli]